MTYRTLDRCVVCDGTNLKKYWDAGEQPLANSFHDGTKELPTFPLGLQVCLDCWHSQQLVAVDPHLMFDHYDYVSGTSRTLGEYFDWFVGKVEDDFPPYPLNPIRPKLRILEIGSNDGTLLGKFQKRNHIVVGVDPASNLRTSDGPPIYQIVDYWNDASAQAALRPLGGKKFDAVIAMNVLAHTAEPLPFLKLCEQVLAPGGRIYVQTSQADMVRSGEFDTCYHEHISFFSPYSFLMLTRSCDLKIIASSVQPIHGGSFLLEIAHEDRSPPPDLAEAAMISIQARMADNSACENFSDRALNKKSRIVLFLNNMKETNTAVVGYGAAAKGNTFLNYCGIDLDYIVDDNPLKIGKLTPGRNIPVVSTDRLAADDRKLAILILAWNFKDEIIERIKRVRPDRDDVFITAFPVVSVSK